jgi:rhamnulokinase
MGNTKNFLAIDLGAGSGRGIIGKVSDKKIELHEVNRFDNQIITLFGHDYWDIYDLYEKIKASIKIAAGECGTLEGIGIDSWGVDFVFLDKGGNIIGLPNMYRDSRTDGIPEKLFKKISKDEIYKETGIQFLKLNSLYQIYSFKLENPDMFEYIDKVLFLPDYLNYLLTGKKVNEYTISSTSQMLNAASKKWSMPILKALGIAEKLFSDVTEPGTVIGKIHPKVKDELGINDVDILQVPCHDTASAIVAVPAKGNNWAYLSSGTWSLLGVELDKPLINDDTYKNNYTNEGGVFDTIRFLKNVSGLWLLQESKRIWEEGGIKYSYDEMIKRAGLAKPFQGFIDTDAEIFLKPDNMPDAINEYLFKTGQKEIKDHFSIVRIILEGLALKYREVIEVLGGLIDKKIEVLHIIGGGSKNDLLNQMTADSTGLKIVAGPSEATALGNLLLQANAKGIISGLDEAREIVRNSFELKEFEQKNSTEWGDAYIKFKNIQSKAEGLWKN